MNGWGWLGVVILVGVVALLGLNAKDVARYLKIKSM